MKAKILLVDDDPQSLESTRKILEFSGYDVVTATDGQAALDLMRVPPGKPRPGFDLIVTDVRMPRLGGLEFLRALSLCGDHTPVVLMTAFGRVEEAVWAMKFGAVDFLMKPFKRQTLLSSLEAALRRSSFNGSRVKSSERRSQTQLLIGASEPIQTLRSMIEQVAPTSATVLIQGESGTGKELVARCIHDRSPRASANFIALNCAAVPESLIESELFGHEKGAFTGAGSAKVGLFEAANEGTLLLDEIGDMPLALQAKLLRALQEGEIRRIGSTGSRKVNVRVIAATHRDLKESVRAGTFREDLLYRLEVISLRTPSLRERMSDLPDMAYYFLRTANERHQKQVEGISEEVMESLISHAWPGNVRELSNVIERGVIFARGTYLMPEDLPPHLVGLTQSGLPERSISIPLGTSLRDVEELLIRKTLEVTDGDKNMTAKLLGINSRTIYRKLDKKPD